jgi:hypothetical protein
LLLSATMVQPQQNSSYNLNFGREEYSNYAFYGGGLDDIRIYNRALSLNEVQQLYSFEAAPLPVITSQPQSVVTNFGSAVNFNVSATGANGVWFQWLKDGVPLPNATNSLLALTNVQPPSIGNYAAVVTGFSGSVTSSVASLALNGVDSGIWDGLVAYYPFHGNANDESGFGNNAVRINTLDTVDRFGNPSSAFAFDGVGTAAGSKVIFTNTPINLGQQGYTVNLWFKLNNLAQLLQVPFSGANTPVGITLSYNDNNAPGYVVFDIGPGNAFWTTLYSHGPKNDYQLGHWYSLSLTKSGTSYALYIDGQKQLDLVIPAAAGYDFAFQPLIGAYAPNGFEAFNGDIDDVRIYNRALSSNEVAQLYAYESVPPPVNLAPVLAAVPPQTVEERLTWSYRLSATDANVPTNTLTYGVVSGPAGLTVNPTTGAATWTPGEADGGQVYSLVFKVTDDGVPPLSATNTVSLTVTKVNNPPTLAAIPDATLPEGSPWTSTATGQDLDLPMQTLGYTVVSGPAGLTINPTSGALSWTPTEAQGPGTYSVTVRVADPGGLTADRTFTLTVTEVNAPPLLAAVADQQIVYGQTVALTLGATDTDQPPNPLTFRLANGPTNAVVTAAGQFSWTPIRSQAPSTNDFRVAVSDGTVSVTNSFRVVVVDLVLLVNGVEATGTVGTLPPVTLAFTHERSDWLLFYSLDTNEPSSSSLYYLEPFALEASATVWPVLFSPDFSQSILGLPVRVNVLKPQTLGIAGGNGLVHLGPGVPIAAASDSGLPVSLEVVGGPAKIEGGQLVPLGGGTVTLRAQQAGNETWAPASLTVERTVAAAAQTIVWTPVPGQVFGAGAVTLSATASSGLPVSYAVVAGPGTLAGAQLTPTGAGTVAVRATQGGNANFLAATADTAVTVAKAGQTLSFAALANRPFSTTPIPLVASASSGLPVAFSVLSGPATVTGSQLTLTGVGPVVLRATQAGNANYDVALPKDQSFTVAQGAQTLTFTGVGPKTFGDAPVTLAATSGAGLPVTFQVLSGPGTLSGGALALTGAGSIVVQAQQAGNALYLPATSSQTVAVAKAAQTLAFIPPAVAGYTTNAIPLVGTATSGLPVAFRVVGGAAMLNGSELRLTGVGAVAVAADQAGDANWLAAASVTNTFTVGRGEQTIAFTPIGDQVLGNPPVTLAATSSAGLLVSYAVLSGPASASAGQLTLLNEGTVTVRALNPGSPLWLAAQTDQTFAIRKLTTLEVTVTGTVGGTVTVDPVKQLYAPTDNVTLTAVASAGFAFGGWSGDLGGNANPATLAMGANRKVAATFLDVGAPEIAWTLPVAGPTSDERVQLGGRITDNIGVTVATWSRDGGAGQTLALAGDGTFAVDGLVLNLGTNRFTVTARDLAGNQTTQERVVVWVPDRILLLSDAAGVQEGQRAVFTLSLVSTGEVSGLNLELAYDTNYLADPKLVLSSVAAQSISQVSTQTPGVLRMVLSLPGTTLPRGTQTLATVSFRARSVPFSLDSIVTPTIKDIAAESGAALVSANATRSGSVRISRRIILGDNNANQTLDIGDAVVMQQLLVGLAEERSWDGGLNDLNQNGGLDSGDVTKVLRAVVGLDVQPNSVVPGAVSGGLRGNVRQFGDPPPSVLVNSNDLAAFQFPDGPLPKVGQPYHVVVDLTRLDGPISGLSFRLGYPTNALQLVLNQLGSLVPGQTVPLWNLVPGQANLAVIGAATWPNTNGAAAIFTFLPLPALVENPTWTLTLDKLQVTGSGFDIRSLDNVAATVKGTDAPTAPPLFTLSTTNLSAGHLSVKVAASIGTTLVLQSSTNLVDWTPFGSPVAGQGTNSPVPLSLPVNAAEPSRFFRLTSQ